MGFVRAGTWIVFLAVAIGLLHAGSCLGQPTNFTLDFEEGDLRGWDKSGSAFEYQPTRGDNARARGAGRSHHQGDYWIGTYERYQGGPNEQPGTIQGDEPEGTLVSPVFMIPSGTLSFLVGGGADYATRVELVVYGVAPGIAGSSAPLHASGRNAESMERVTWNLEPYAGRRGQIRIVDDSPGPWGHINVDDFRFAAAADELVEVPDLMGLTIAQALGRLTDSQLRQGDVSRRESDRPTGTIINQDPSAGTRVPINSRVDLVTAVAARVEVPNVVGRQRDWALDTLLEAGLKRGDVEEIASVRPEGTVLEQTPPAGTKVVTGSEVNLVVVGTTIVEVPNLAGRQSEVAEAMIAEAGLELGQVDRRPSDETEGTVIGQAPAAGTMAPAGTPVSLIIALMEMVAVPPLVGIDWHAAREAIEGASLALGTVEERPSDAEAGTVLEQAPAAGTEVSVGSQVGLVIATTIQIEVPDLLGLDSGQAATALAGSDLQLGAISQRPSDEPPGTVLEQDPDAGSMVAVGTPIGIVIASPSLVTVPDLVGLNQDAAVESISSATLQRGQVRERVSDGPAGVILGQRPPAGSEVPSGTAVDLVISVPARIEVPDLSGLERDEAEAELEAAGLALGTLSPPTPDESMVVVGQTPAAGSMVTRGTVVDLTMGTPGLVPWKTVVGICAVAAAIVVLTRADVIRRCFGRGKPTVQVRPHQSMGAQSIESGAPVDLNIGLRLRCVPGSSESTVEAEDPSRIVDRRSHE